MQTLTVSAPAKINLSLDVVGRRTDGYHLLSTVMQSISLADRVTVSLAAASQPIRLSCSQGGIPLDSRNTAWRAASQFLAAAGLEIPITIHVDKQIPVAAGLGGGSADAAAVLLALDRLCPGRLARADLFGLAAAIGADVPFCLQGGTALCTGVGEVLAPVAPFDNMPLLLCKPAFGLSTPWVFGQLDCGKLGRRPDQAAVLAALARRDLPGLAASTANVLESVSLPAYPVLREFREMLLAAGAVVAMMSGSGPTVFGLFADQATCAEACRQLTAQATEGTRVLMAATSRNGPQVLA